MEKKLSNIEREKKEDNLRLLAQKARDARVGLKAPVLEGEISEVPSHMCCYLAECVVWSRGVRGGSGEGPAAIRQTQGAREAEEAGQSSS